MFQKNIEALKNKNPRLAQSLQGISLEDAKQDIAVHNAESGDLIISYKNMALHSVYDPKREAKTTWNKTVSYEAGKNDMQIIFGLGLGYLFKRAYINAPSRVVIFEPFINVLRFVLEYVDFSAELADNRVYLTDNLEECFEYIGAKYLGNDKIEVLYLNSYAQLAQKELLDFSQGLLEICELRKMDSQTIISQCRLWATNNIQNLKNYDKARAINYLEKSFVGKTALIASAGPSLKNDIAKIKENRDKFVLICVNKAVKTLVNNGITPDFVVFADGDKVAYFMGEERSKLVNSNLILGSRTDNFAYTIPSNTKFVYFSKTDSFGEFVEKATNGNFKAYESAGTTSIISYFIAKQMGFSKFVFSGLDLAFTDNKAYPDVALELDVEGKLAEKFEHVNIEVLKVKDVNGNDILTRADYALFIRQFEEILEKEQGDNVINTSKGAYVKGMEYSSLEKALEVSSEIGVDINNALTELNKRTKDEWAKFKDGLGLFVLEEKNQLGNIKNIVRDLVPILKEIDTYIVNNGKLEGMEEQARQSIEWSAQILDVVLNTMFLSQYMQNELYNLVNKQNKSMFTELKDYKAKVEAELSFYNSLVEAVDTLTAAMNTVVVSLQKA